MNFNPKYPLVLDVDGTLIRNDLTHDLLIQSMSLDPIKTAGIIKTGLTSKSIMKSELVAKVGHTIDVSVLPYNKLVIELAEQHHARGGIVVLCSGSHQTIIDKISNHLPWVSEAYGTQGDVNLTKSTKAEFLSSKYPDGFHYIGNSTHDYPVWRVAKTAGAINPPQSVDTVETAEGKSVEVLERNKLSLKTFLKCIRIHQWVKNGLIGLVPLLTFASLTPQDFLSLLLGFFSMSLLASATYIFNDLIDIPDDRRHHSKNKRPLASGAMSIPLGIIIMMGLALLSIALLIFLPTMFAFTLAVYFVLTVSYSFFVKRVAILDVIMLAGLFTIRVIAGATLVDQGISPWLLNFIASFFLSLALVKRYTECRKKEENSVLLGRGYSKDDEPLLLSLGIMGTGLAILSFLLYSVLAEEPVIHTQSIRFVLLTVLTYWLMRIWFLAHRKTLNDDPVLFAVKDKVSVFLGVLIATLVIFEQIGQI